MGSRLLKRWVEKPLVQKDVIEQRYDRVGWLMKQFMCLVLAGEQEILFSSNYACKICGFSVPVLEPRLFSFNAPLGACDVCHGLGITQEVDLDYLMPDRSKSILQGGIRYYKNIAGSDNIEWQTFAILCKAYKISLSKPLDKMSGKEMQIILYGSDKPISYSLTSSGGNTYKRTDYIEGVKSLIERRFVETQSAMSKEWYQSYMKKDIKADGYPADTADDLFVGCLFSGIVAARIWYCLFSDPAYYFGNPVHLLEIYKGGIGIQGGILGGLAYAYFYCRRHKISLLRMCDAVMRFLFKVQKRGIRS